MRSNPYPDEPTSVQRSDFLPQKERMEDLQPKPTPPPEPRPTPIIEPIPVIVDSGQDDARTIKYAIGKLSDFLQWFTMVLEGTLAIRFFLMLIGADPANLFASFIYALTGIILVPFASIVPSPSVHVYQAFEWSTLIAMAIYALVFWGTRRFLLILISSPEEPIR